MDVRSLRALLALAALVLGLGASLLVAGPAGAGPADDEAQFVALVNQARSGAGLAPLATHGELTALGRRWADAQAQAGAISHNPALASSVSAPWTLLGENVGRGGSVPAIFDALMASSSHRANILNPRFNHIGVGVTHAPDGTIYTSHQFMELPGTPPAVIPAAAPAPEPPPPPPPTTVPPTTVPPTTVPPTTVPPTTVPPTLVPEPAAAPTSTVPPTSAPIATSTPPPSAEIIESTDDAASGPAIPVPVVSLGALGIVPLAVLGGVAAVRRRRAD